MYSFRNINPWWHVLRGAPDVPGPFCLYKEHQGRSERTKACMEAVLSQAPPRASLKQLSPKRQQEELSIGLVMLAKFPL